MAFKGGAFQASLSEAVFILGTRARVPGGHFAH